MMITLPADYRPSEAEEFMNPLHVEYFRRKLLRWRSDLLREADGPRAASTRPTSPTVPASRRIARSSCAPGTAPES